MKKYLDRKSSNQNLNFNQLKEAFARAKINKKDMTKILERLIDFEENYTNLALILSDENPFSIKMVTFDDEYNVVDKQEFEGAIFEQYFQLYTQLEPLKSDYPSFVLREAIGNAIIHRDYSFDGDTLIHIHPHFIEITSIGGIMDGFKTIDLMNGVSVLRNKKLSEIFTYMGLSEGYGAGLKRIQSVYSNYDKTISLHTTFNSFKITIPDIHTCKEKIDRRILTNKEKKILNLLEEFTELTELQLQEKMNIKQSRSYLLTKTLSEKGYIEIIGRGNTRKYKLKEGF